MIKRQITELLKAFPNMGRSLAPMLFNAFVFYVLNKTNNQLLLSYTWFLVTAYFMITITGWGLRDYMVKEYSQNMHRQNEIFGTFFRSKLPLVVLVIVGALAFSGKVHEMLFLLLFVLARTGIGLLEPLILVNKKVAAVFASEMIAYLLAVLVFYFALVPAGILFFVVVGVEIWRFAIAWILVRPSPGRRENKKSAFQFLNQTKFYFFIALFSFCMSRVDAFILGFCREDISFSHYNIILTLIAASQIVISSIYNQNLKSVFKLEIRKAWSLLDKMTRQFFFLAAAATLVIYGLAVFFYLIEVPPVYFLLIFGNLFCFCLTIKYLFILNHANRPALFLVASIVSSAVNILVSFLIIPLYGMQGALASNTLAAVILVAFIRIGLARIDLSNSSG